MAVAMDINQEALDAWLKTRPRVIQEMVRLRPPGLLYRLKSSGHRVVIYSYDENRTVTVLVLAKYNVVGFERRVFGIAIDDLEECDIPTEDEAGVAVLTQEELADAIAKGHDKESRMKAVDEAIAAKLAAAGIKRPT